MNAQALFEVPVVGDRTYGTYTYIPATPDRHARAQRGHWELALEPNVAMRVKRILGRVEETRVGTIIVADSQEIARDLEWIMERWPLVPGNGASYRQIRKGATAHRAKEAAVSAIASGSTRPSNPPRDPAKPAREYQLSAVEMLRTTGKLLLTDDLGLGKTYTGLLAGSFPDSLPILVVPQAHLPKRWVNEVVESFPWMTHEVAKKSTPPPGWTPEDLPDVMIVPYSKLGGWAAHLRGHVKTVVFDEVQELRTGTGTVKGTAAASICAEARYRLGLSATPLYGFGGETWNIYDIIAPGELGTRDEFIREWGHLKMNGHIEVKNPKALGAYLREQGLMLGRTRKQVGRELPDTIKISHVIDADESALDAIKGDAVAMAKLILASTSSTQQRFQAARELDWKMRQATGIAKAPFVADFARMVLESEEKVIVGAWHREVYGILMERLAEFNPVLYTGSETASQKNAAEDAFVNGDSRVMLMSLRSGSGVDGLQKVCRTVIFGELDWSPQVHEQMIGRVRRDDMMSKGGEAPEPPVAYFLNAASGSDPAVMEVLGMKRRQSGPMLDPDWKMLGGGSAADTSRMRALAMQVLGGTEDA